MPTLQFTFKCQHCSKKLTTPGTYYKDEINGEEYQGAYEETALNNALDNTLWFGSFCCENIECVKKDLRKSGNLSNTLTGWYGSAFYTWCNKNKIKPETIINIKPIKRTIEDIEITVK